MAKSGLLYTVFQTHPDYSIKLINSLTDGVRCHFGARGCPKSVDGSEVSSPVTGTSNLASGEVGTDDMDHLESAEYIVQQVSWIHHPT